MGKARYIEKSDSILKNWRQINNLVEDNATLERLVRSQGRAIDELRRRTDYKEKGGGGGKIRRVQLLEVREDTYLCADGISQFVVAKPWKLRKTPFHGQTQSIIDEDGRVITSVYTYLGVAKRRVELTSVIPNVVELQVIIPRYIPTFDTLFVSEVENSVGTVINLGGGAVTWQDINADGRAWARIR